MSNTQIEIGSDSQNKQLNVSETDKIKHKSELKHDLLEIATVEVSLKEMRRL